MTAPENRVSPRELLRTGAAVSTGVVLLPSGNVFAGGSDKIRVAMDDPIHSGEITQFKNLIASIRNGHLRAPARRMAGALFCAVISPNLRHTDCGCP